MRIGLVGCVKGKLASAAPAKDLYSSDLFRCRRGFVEQTCDRWFILSAELGLVDPDELIEPYDLSLNDATDADRRRWSASILRELQEAVGGFAGHVFEFHAGESYREFGLRKGIEDGGGITENPTKGLGLGEQLRFYREAGACGDPTTTVVAPAELPDLARSPERAREAGRRLLEAWRGPGIFGQRSMPESAPPAEVAVGSREHANFITLTVALDWMRDAAALWAAARTTFEDPDTRWVFDTEMLGIATEEDVRAALTAHGVAQRPQEDCLTWRAVGRGIATHFNGDPREGANLTGGSAPALLAFVQDPSRAADFRRLRGAKIGPLWIRMLVDEVGLDLTDLHAIPIPVDVHIARSTFAIGGLAGKYHGSVDDARALIEGLWREACADAPFFPLELDQALWLQSRDGCSSRVGSTCPREAHCVLSDLCVRGRLSLADGVLDVDTTLDSSMAASRPPSADSFMTAWHKVEACAGQTFHRADGTPFTFKVVGTAVRPSTVEVSIYRSQFEKAWERRPLTAVADLQDLFGPSYLYAILRDPRVEGSVQPKPLYDNPHTPDPEPTPAEAPAPDPPRDGLPAIVLVKAARVRQHLQENLRLLEIPAGEAFTVTYHRRWMAPSVLSRHLEGLTALVALSNSPYRQVHPLRLARITGVTHQDDLVYEIHLELGDFVDPDSTGFSAEIDASDGELSVGRHFVVPAPSGWQPRAIGPAERPAAWRRLVRLLATTESYRSSCFLRLDGFEVDGTRIPAEADAPIVQVGQTVAVLVESLNPHLDEQVRAGIRLLADAATWTVTIDQALPPEGVLRIPLSVEPEDRPALGFSVGVRPRWADSSVLPVELQVALEGESPSLPDLSIDIPGTEPGAPAVVEQPQPSPEADSRDAQPPASVVVGIDPDAVSLRPQEVHRLIEALRRDGWDLSLSVLEDHLLRWFPGDARLEDMRLRLLAEEGRLTDVVSILGRMDAALLAGLDPWIRFRAAVHRQDSRAALGALDDVITFGPDEIDVVADALQTLPSDAVRQVVERLGESLLGESAFSSLLKQLDPIRLDADVVLPLADYIEQALSGHEALDFLQKRLDVAFDDAIAQQAAHIAASLGGQQHLGAWTEDLLLEDLEQRGPESALARLDSLRTDLSVERRREIVLHLAERMRPLGPLVPHLELVAREAITHKAWDAAVAVCSLLAKTGHGGEADALEAELREALELTATVRRYLAKDYDERKKRAQGATNGRVLIIVGGPKEKTELKESLSKEFGFSSVEWLPCHIGKKPPLDKFTNVNAKQHTVLIIIGHVGHSTSEPVKKLCAKNGVRPATVETDGRQSIEWALVTLYSPLPE